LYDKVNENLRNYQEIPASTLLATLDAAVYIRLYYALSGSTSSEGWLGSSTEGCSSACSYWSRSRRKEGYYCPGSLHFVI